ncbi:MAG: histidine phosphatase family protein [Gemmatimonadota bacterium]
MARELILIRHAESARDFDVPAEAWDLTARGRAPAEALAGAEFWPRVDLLLTSDERKAMATAAPAAARHGLTAVPEPGLREVRRPAGRIEPWEAAVRGYLEGRGEALGWEPAASAGSRIAASLGKALLEHPAATIAAVSHGSVLALYVGRLLGLEDVHALWSEIPFAAWASLDPDEPRLLRRFG